MEEKAGQGIVSTPATTRLFRPPSVFYNPNASRPWGAWQCNGENRPGIVSTPATTRSFRPPSVFYTLTQADRGGPGNATERTGWGSFRPRPRPGRFDHHRCSTTKTQADREPWQCTGENRPGIVSIVIGILQPKRTPIIGSSNAAE